MSDTVVCVGFCCVDVLVRGLGDIDRTKELIPADKVTMWIGGDAMNEAYVLNRLGKDVRLMTGFGDDPPADLIRSVLDRAKVDYSLSNVKENSDTSIALPVVYASAERGIISAGLADSLSFYMDPDKLQGAAVVSLASLYFPPLSDEKNTLEIVKRAKENGSIVCADMMWTDDGSCTIEKYRDVWPYIDYFFPNEEEIRNLTGKETIEEMADILLGCGVGHVVIKTGKRGCMARSREDSIIVPPFLVEAKDTTGAGDNFAAGFITGLLEHKNLEECCRYANAAASIAVRYDGASTAIKSRSQLQEVLDSRKE